MSTQPNHPLIAAAKDWYDAGYCVVPTHTDGGKRPDGLWKQHQTERLPYQQLVDLLNTNRYTGIGIITGQVSGNVEMIELEAVAYNNGSIGFLRDLAERHHLTPLLNQLLDGCVELTPTLGLHTYARCSDTPIPGNLKLARQMNRETGQIQVLAETRGEGGFSVVAPTPGRKTHPNGSIYLLAPNTHPNKTPTFTGEQLTQLHWLFTQLDDMPTEPPKPTKPSNNTTTTSSSDLTSWEDWANQTTWTDILTPAGWTHMHSGQRNGHPNDTWCRPGKKPEDGPSATTAGEDGPLYIFSSSTTLPSEEGLSKFYVYSHYNHHDDMAEAARTLAREGYGTPSVTYDPLNTWNSPQPQPTNPDNTPAENRHQQLVNAELARLRATRQAKQQLDNEEHQAQFREPPSRPTLTQELALPDDPITYRVNEIMPTGSNVLLTAQYKTGKTTLNLNLLKALADGEPFLGRYDINPLPDGKKAVWWNYEVDERQARRWLRDLNIQNLDRIAILNLRGYRLTLTTDRGEDWAVQWLADHDAAYWQIDPAARAMVGSADENSNSEVGHWLDTLDIIKERAGVDELTLATHTGRIEQQVGSERARGATRLDDWADVRWLLTKDEDDRRYLRFTGRDVDIDEEEITYDPDTRQLRASGRGGRKAVKAHDLADAIYDYIKTNPGKTQTNIKETVTQGKAGERWNMVNKLLTDGRIRSEQNTGQGGGKVFYVTELGTFDTSEVGQK